MPPKSKNTRQNSVVNSRVGSESNGHSQAVGRAQQTVNNRRNMEREGNKRKKPTKKDFLFLKNHLAFTLEEMMVISDKWVNDDVIKLTKVNKLPL